MTMPTAATPDVVVAGHICLDIIPDLKQIKLGGAAAFFTPGKLRNTDAAVLSTGGPVSNTGIALIKLGIAAALMGKLGEDPFGQIVHTLLRQWNADAGMIDAKGATTSYTIALSPPGLDRMFLHCPGANDTFAAADVDYDLVAKAKLFHLGYPPLMQRMYSEGGKQLIEIFKRVKALGVTTSLDMSLPDPDSPGGKADWRSILERLVPHVDLFLPSAEEATFMLNRAKFEQLRAAAPGADLIPQFTGDDLHALSTQLLAIGGKIVAIKCSHRGIYLRTAGKEVLSEIGRAKPGDVSAWAGREMWHPAFTITCPPNATGSGDSAIGGFLAAYLRGHGPSQALQCGNGAGAWNVMAPDAVSGIKSWGELIAALEAGWRTQALEVDGHGWHRGKDGLWHGPSETN